MAMRRHSGGVGEASPPPAPRSDNAGSLNDVIADLADLDANGLCLQWRNHLGGAPPAHLPRWLLIRVLAYQIQVAALGGLDKATQRVIRQPKGRTLDFPCTPRACRRAGAAARSQLQLQMDWRDPPGEAATKRADSGSGGVPEFVAAPLEAAGLLRKLVGPPADHVFDVVHADRLPNVP